VTHPADLENFLIVANQMGQTVVRHYPQGFGPSHVPPGGEFIGPGLTPSWLTIYTSMFMHASLLHIGGNMLFLWIFGNNIEDALGKIRFLIFYFVCGTAAAAGQILISPNSLIPNLGASGAIAGVLGAYLVLYPNARVLTIVPLFFAFLVRLRAWWVLAFWIALQIIQGLNGLSGPGATAQGGVAYFAHIGGFFAGVLIILAMGGRNLVEQQRQRAYRISPPPNRWYR
jgi:membrane associated rhomboid family serine protease